MHRGIAAPRTGTGSGEGRTSGFTLIELVIVMGMLAMVLVTAYQILENCLNTERHIERITLPEKAGEAILSLVRRDLSASFYRGLTERLNRQVFVGTNNESSEGPNDELGFLTTVEPTQLQGGGETWQEEIENVRSVTFVHWFLEPNPELQKWPGYTLYRKEVTEFGTGSVRDAPGLSLEIYDKVRSFNVQYYDGYEWLTEWSSERQIEAQEVLLKQQAERQQGLQDRLSRVSEEEEAAAEALPAQQETVLPPPAIPTAVRVEIELYAGTGNEVFEQDGQPITRTFRTIVPLFASHRIPLQLEAAGEGVVNSGRLEPGEEGGGARGSRTSGERRSGTFRSGGASRGAAGGGRSGGRSAVGGGASPRTR